MVRIVNSCIRSAISHSARRYAGSLEQRLKRYRTEQTALFEKYSLTDIAPQGYTEEVRSTQRELQRSHPGSQLILTSGSTSTPKEIWYTEQRLQDVQSEFVRQVLLLAHESTPLASPSIYFLTSLHSSRSLSSALLRTPQLNAIERTALFNSIVFAPCAIDLAAQAPEAAVHIAYIMLTRPAILVAANPSSILLLIQRTISEWMEQRMIVRNLIPKVWGSLSPIDRLGYGGADTLAQALAHTERDTITCHDLLQHLEAVACWTGGYVQPYLTRLTNTLSHNDLRILSLPSLSSEEILGLWTPNLRGGDCLPISQNVVYEFLREGDPSQKLLKPWELTSGERYVMVVSNRYGLARYDTADLFLCRGREHDAPIITFVGRAGLQHSFSGEKLTAPQLLQAYQRAYAELSLPVVETLCLPEPGSGDELPHYVFLVTVLIEQHLHTPLARAIDSALCAINEEYEAKRRSARLAEPQLHTRSLAQVIAALGDRAAPQQPINRAQIKLLPLYPQLTWSELLRSL
jgi:hypothetical protein